LDLMFGKYWFNVKSNYILNTRFNYNPSKLTPAQRAMYHEIVNDCHGANGKPVDAAVLFMLVQGNMLVGATRERFADNRLPIIGQLLPEMSLGAQEQFGVWAAEFDAESSKQAAETAMTNLTEQLRREIKQENRRFAAWFIPTAIALLVIGIVISAFL
jgi:hypothetical protein